jgi:uncharacterized protein with ParB-like and HNH nuclease domain
MQANPRSIDDLFNAQSRYIVPMFQRLYVWNEYPQWKTLWEDVAEKASLQLDGTKANPHYLGALIIEGVKPTSSREVKRLLVIDGQQRLTTLQLMLCAFRDFTRSKGWKTLDRTTTRYLENADADVMERPEEEIFKLWPTQLNREVFARIITAGSRATVDQRYPLIRLPRKRKPEPRSNLVESYLYFYREVSNWINAEAAKRQPKSQEDCAFALLQAIKLDFCVVEISLSDGDDSQEIFYSLNSQGRPLSQSDLLRSLIFMRAEKELADRDKLFSDYWGKFETSFWSSEVKRGGRTYSRLDLALRHFLSVKKAELVDARRVNEEYKRWIGVNPPRYASVRDELADFSRYADVFQEYESAAGQKLKSTDIIRVIRDFDVSTAIPLLLFLRLEAELTPDQLDQCLSVMQSYIVRRAFLGEETKEYNKMFLEVIGDVATRRGADVLPALTAKLLLGRGTTRAWPSDKRIVEAATRKPVYKEMKQPALRVIMERLELGMRGKKSEEEEMADGLQIEHVMPQRWWTHWQIDGQTLKRDISDWWIAPTEEEKPLVEAARARSAAVQTLGNLSLLNKYANPAASNGPFKLKLAEYGHSVLRLNRYFDKVEQWDEATITKRSRELAELFCKLYPRPATDGDDQSII